ncbi:PilZ domain-containing protein [Geotalea sp. SG265]|uniref:PilZ domain-containing protein n=1 Tax=Geotalea sp. SG265 TaxID=2922867 RepID=UPI001FAF6628|nr:PilZ domain-containing protein [Geotalea sp. SG265]
MKSIKLLVVSSEGEAMDAYRQALDQAGVSYDAATSFHLLSDMVREEAYNGIIIDMLTLVRAGKDEKKLAYELMNFFPTTHIKWDTRTKVISLSMLGEMSPPEAITALNRFIDERCRPIGARRLRMHPRRDVALQIQLSTDPGFPEAGTDRTFTVNISREGCFLHTTRPVETGDTVWLKIQGMADQTPIKGTVCWKVEWGEKLVVPGIGVHFDEIGPLQLAALAKLLQEIPARDVVPPPSPK